MPKAHANPPYSANNIEVAVAEMGDRVKAKWAEKW